MKHECEYQVALSFAGEQRDYVEEVSKELSNLGIRHFYDNSNRADLWGKNLTIHLDEIYFSKSQFVVAFISHEYRDKIWTRWEMASAQDRALRQANEYILPVYFDDVRLPGLIGSLGHIDARGTTPKELAQLILAKLTDKSICNNPKRANYQFHAPVAFPMELHQAEKTQLEVIYNNHDSSVAVIACGEKGVGKRSSISSFLNGRENVIHVIPINEPHYQYEAIVNALGNQSIFSCTDDLSIPERIKKYIFDFCRGNNVIIYFESVDQYETGLIKFIIDVCTILLLHHPEYRTFMLFEYDDDSGKEIEKMFYSLPPALLKFVYFMRLEAEILRDYLKNTIGDILIDDADMTYIIRSARGNVMYLNTILNYLKMRGLLTKSSDQRTNIQFSERELAGVLSDYIRERYEGLDNSLKDVLNKSAIIGNTFSSELLSKPFGIMHAEELLSKIETVSKLIKREDQKKYSFESLDSFRVVYDAIRPEESREWHRILARFFIRRFERMQNGPITPTEDQIIFHLHAAMRHFKYAGDFKEAAVYTYELIRKYLDISDYYSAQKAISEMHFLTDMLDDEDLPSPDLRYRTVLLEARCLSEMGQFTEASRLYKDCILHSSSMIDYRELTSVKLACALCYYMDGRTAAAIAIAEQVEMELRTLAPNSVQYCDALSLLASFHDSTGEIQKKKAYYTQAITICRSNGYEYEYYRLLKKASMVYDESIAIEMYPAAFSFFESQHQKKNIAELQHNIATDLLYLNRREEIEPYLTESLNTFSSFGSLMIVYPLNTKGILTAVFKKKYEEAAKIFEAALKYESEPYSKIVLKSNLTSCLLKIHRPNDAHSHLLEINELSVQPENANVYDFQIYRSLAWGQYYYHTGDYQTCLDCLEKCIMLPNLEPRFSYMCNYFIFLAKKRLGMDIKMTQQTAPKPVLNDYFREECIFFSLRFYE